MGDQICDKKYPFDQIRYRTYDLVKKRDSLYALIPAALKSNPPV